MPMMVTIITINMKMAVVIIVVIVETENSHQDSVINNDFLLMSLGSSFKFKQFILRSTINLIKKINVSVICNRYDKK